MRSRAAPMASMLAIALTACGGSTAGGATPVPAPSPSPTPMPSPTPTGTASAPCVAGTWTATAPDPNDTVNARLPVQFETQHFVFRFDPGVAALEDTKAAGQHLEYVWTQFIDRIGFPEPDCASATKLKANVYVGADYGLSAGPDGLNHMGIYIGPGGLRDRFGLAHEFTHALQGSTQAYRDTAFGGWMWEMHANWMTVQLPEFRGNTHCSVLSVDYPHLYYGSSRVRYCNWQFFEYLKDRFGYAAINDIWRKAPGRGSVDSDPVQVLMQNMGWSLEQLNDTFGDWALHNANWDYTNPDGSDQGAVYRASYGDYEPTTDEHILRTTVLDPIDLAARRFAVPAAWAPQRWGYNLVRLHPDAGATAVTVTFRGVVQAQSATATLPDLAEEPASIPAPASGWRWGLVAVSADGSSRYAALQRGADGRATIALRPGDRGLYMIVLGAPTQFQHVRWDQPYHSIYRFPWMAQFEGAMPAGYQPDAPAPIAGGHRHANGGGWVAADAQVDAGAWVGPYARVLAGSVLGSARIEDHAVVAGGTVRDRARASALSVIRADTMLRDDARAATVFLGLGEYEKGIVLSGTAQHVGDVEQRGGSFSRGVYSGFVDQAAATDPRRGAALTAAPAEVTAEPAYRWRD